MTGGLAQIVNMGAQDIFLTGNPKYSYYKQTYKRHTNFAIETIAQQFYGSLNFGDESTAKIDKLGDMISRMYLVLDIPGFDVSENTKQSNHLLNLVDEFLAENDRVIRQIYPMNDISKILVAVDDQRLVAARKRLLSLLDQEFVYLVNVIDVSVMVKHWVKRLEYVYDMIIPKLRSIMEKDIQNMSSSLRGLVIETGTAEQKRLRWFDELGHRLVEYVDIVIGDSIFDSHTGTWLSCFRNISPANQKATYDKMIGNVPSMYEYSTKKRDYRVYVPLQFTFNRGAYQAFPIAAIKNDFTINAKLRNLSELLESADGNIPDLNLKGAEVYVDYVFLDEDERKLVLSHSHDFLVEELQIFEKEGIVSNSDVQDLHFQGLAKYITWFYQFSGDSRLFNPVAKAMSLSIGNSEYTGGHQGATFYNYVQSYGRVESSPAEGQYIHSFSLKPLEHQPMGGPVLLTHLNLSTRFNKETTTRMKETGESLKLVVYLVSQNIRRIKGGLIGDAYVTEKKGRAYKSF